MGSMYIRIQIFMIANIFKYFKQLRSKLWQQDKKKNKHGSWFNFWGDNLHPWKLSGGPVRSAFFFSLRTFLKKYPVGEQTWRADPGFKQGRKLRGQKILFCFGGGRLKIFSLMQTCFHQGMFTPSPFSHVSSEVLIKCAREGRNNHSGNFWLLLWMSAWFIFWKKYQTTWFLNTWNTWFWSQLGSFCYHATSKTKFASEANKNSLYVQLSLFHLWYSFCFYWFYISKLAFGCNAQHVLLHHLFFPFFTLTTSKCYTMPPLGCYLAEGVLSIIYGGCSLLTVTLNVLTARSDASDPAIWHKLSDQKQGFFWGLRWGDRDIVLELIFV